MKLTDGQIYGGLFAFLIVADCVSAYTQWLLGTLTAAIYPRIGDVK